MHETASILVRSNGTQRYDRAGVHALDYGGGTSILVWSNGSWDYDRAEQMHNGGGTSILMEISIMIEQSRCA